MNNQDLEQFANIFDGVNQYYQTKEPLSPIALKMYFSALQNYTLEQVEMGLYSHMRGSSGQFYPKAADIIKRLEGGEITPDMIVASAKLANSPLGILCRIHIGSWDLDNQDSFYLRQRAVECQMLIPQWKSRAMAGDYTDHEISIMVKHGVNPVSPFSDGLQSPNNPQALLDRVNAITESPRHKYLIESNSDEITTGQAHPRVLAFLEAENKTV